MNVPIAFECEKCGYHIRSKDSQSDEKVICPECGHENTPPKGHTPPDSVNIWVKGRYYGD
nr:hypothetical protein [Acutalibacter muris]